MEHDRDAALAGRLVWLAAAVAAGAVVVFALVFAVTSGITSAKRSRVRASWTEMLGTDDELLARFPPRDPNAAALELERLAAEVGIDLATRSAAGRTRPDADRASQYSGVARELGAYLTRQLTRATSEIDSPPAAVTAFIERHGVSLQAIHERLSAPEPPRWELHLERLFEAPIPNLLGQINLHRLLLVEALTRLHAGDTPGALAALDASWRLRRALEGDPVLITQMIVISVTRWQVGVLRRVPAPPGEWRERLRELDSRERLRHALATEGWVLAQLERELPGALADDREGFLSAVLGSLGRPFFAYCVLDVSERWRAAIEHLDRTTSLCGESAAPVRLDPPRWNVAASMAPSFDEAIERVARLELDTELTERWLDLDAERERRGGRWPAGLPGGRASDACAGAEWIVSVSTDGTVSLALSRDIGWKTHPGSLMLPASHSSTGRRGER